MTEPYLLESFPPWYQHEDPDEFVYALMYVVVALATIWLLEYICELILFSTAKGILLSDGAAHIALNNSNWLDIVRWVWSMDKNSRLCRRALMALVFRLVLVGLLKQDARNSVDTIAQSIRNPPFHRTWRRTPPCLWPRRARASSTSSANCCGTSASQQLGLRATTNKRHHCRSKLHQGISTRLDI